MKSSFHVLVKPTGAACNLDCAYCFYLPKEKLYPGSDFRMSDKTIRAYLKQLLEVSPESTVPIAFQGGEPTLMGLDFYQRAVNYAKKYKKPGQTLEFSIQTNGVLLDAAWAEFFRRHHFLVGISLDGPPVFHDTYRLDKGGQPTFDRVWKGLDTLKKYRVEFNILCAVNAANGDHPLEVYRFLRDNAGAQFIQFIPIVERQNMTGFQEGNTVTPRSIKPEQWGRGLIEIFDEWIQHDVGRVFITIFESALANWLGVPAGTCVFQPTCGLALAIEHNGDLYACDHFVEPKYFLGNIHDTRLDNLVTSKAQQNFGQAKQDTLPCYCRECSVRFACHGECPKDRFVNTPDGESGLNYLCAGYKQFFQHIDLPMHYMANELRNRRSPANVMAYIAAIAGNNRL